VKLYSKAERSARHEVHVIKQVLKPDMPLTSDIILAPGTETVLLILPDHLTVEEVQIFEKFLNKVDSLKIVIVGGSSDKGHSIGIQILKPLNLSEVLSASNMLPAKRVHKKGEMIILASKT
jgi:hypothetical protein